MKDHVAEGLRIVLTWAFFVIMIAFGLAAVHEGRIRQIQACERSHVYRDAPVALFARSAQAAREATFAKEGRPEDKKAALIYRGVAERLEFLANQDCEALYPAYFLGV